jgi:hypothetical protein
MARGCWTCWNPVNTSFSSSVLALCWSLVNTRKQAVTCFPPFVLEGRK